MSTNSSAGYDSLKPYLLRAIHQWAVDSQLTPQVLVDARGDGVVVPREHVRDGRITLNLHPRSVHHLQLGDSRLLFSARFSGRVFEVCVPVDAIAAIYCRENGRGIVFHLGDEVLGQPDAQPNAQSSAQHGAQPNAQLDAQHSAPSNAHSTHQATDQTNRPQRAQPKLRAVEPLHNHAAQGEPPQSPPRKRAKPYLKLVK